MKWYIVGVSKRQVEVRIIEWGTGNRTDLNSTMTFNEDTKATYW